MKYLYRFAAFVGIYLPLFAAMKQTGFGTVLTPIAVGIAFYGSKPVTNFFMSNYIEKDVNNSGQENK